MGHLHYAGPWRKLPPRQAQALHPTASSLGRPPGQGPEPQQPAGSVNSSTGFPVAQGPALQEPRGQGASLPGPLGCVPGGLKRAPHAPITVGFMLSLRGASRSLPGTVNNWEQEPTPLGRRNTVRVRKECLPTPFGGGTQTEGPGAPPLSHTPQALSLLILRQGLAKLPRLALSL